MKTRTWNLFVGMFTLALAGTGCLGTCDQLCAENARYIDGCLETWESTWRDFGYDGLADVDTTSQDGTAVARGQPYPGGHADEYVDRCKSRYNASTYFVNTEMAREVRVECMQDLNRVSSSVGCLDYEPSDAPLDPTDD